ncbi:MAG: large conductance mechanosensitive channel protein MscL, partial [Hymenobacter sp.]
MGFVSEFKEFISKGNVLDLAVGVIIGGAFGKIVTSLTDDIIMPILSVFTSGIDFKEKFFALNGQHYETLKAAQDAKAAVVSYGSFINAVIYFLIIAFVIFWVVKMANRFKKPVAPVVAAAPV